MMILDKGLLLLSIISVFFTLGRFLFWKFPLELLTHFQVYYFWVTLLLVPVVVILLPVQKIRSRITLFILLFTLVVNGLELANWYLPNQRMTLDKTHILRVMTFNIHIENSEVARLVNSIISANPDLVLTVEIDQTMKKNIETRVKDRFPYSFQSPGGGLAVFSKLPLEDSSGQKFPGSNATNLVTHIRYQNQQIQIIGTHPQVPVKLDRFTSRNQQLSALVNHLQYEDRPTILMGDFNLTPWSPYYQQFINKASLHNTRSSFGILPTWIRPSTTVNLPRLLLPFLNIPIDHIFVSKMFKFANTYTGDNGNSDHAPIISELVVSP